MVDPGPRRPRKSSAELEFKDEVIEVLFDDRENPVEVLVDNVRKVSTRQS
jgi:hypothetical protein